jgi:hypothetical protein
MNDSYLLDAGWVFFAAWGVVVLFVSWAAFGRELFPVGSGTSSTAKPRSLGDKSAR